MQLYYRQFSDLIVQALGKEKGLEAMLINYNVLQQLMESSVVVWISGSRDGNLCSAVQGCLRSTIREYEQPC